MKALINKFDFRECALWGMFAMWFGLTFSSAMVEISFAASLVFWALLRLKTGRLSDGKHDMKLLAPLLAFGLIGITSYFWSESQPQSFRGVFKIAQQLMIFWLAADLFQNKKGFEQLRLIFLFTFLFVVFNGIYQYAYGFDFVRGFEAERSSAGVRISSSFKNYGLLAAYLLLMLPVIFTSGLSRKPVFDGFGGKPNQLMFGVLALVGLLILFWTRSRGAFLAFLLGLFCCLFLMRQFKILGLLALVSIAAFLVLPKSTIIHLDKYGKEQSIVERYYLWDRALNVIKTKPLTGTGINTYAVAHQKYDKTRSWRVRNYYAHNGYLQTAAEIGIPGVSAFVLFMALLFRRGLNNLCKKEDSALLWGFLVGLLNYLFFVMTDTIFHSGMSAMQFWFICGVFYAYLQSLQQDTSLT